MAHGGSGGRYIGNPLYDGLTDSSSATAATTSATSNTYHHNLPHNANLDLNSSAVRRRQAFFNSAAERTSSSYYNHHSGGGPNSASYKRQASDDPALRHHYRERDYGSSSSGSYGDYLQPPNPTGGYSRSSYDGVTTSIGAASASTLNLDQRSSSMLPRHHSMDSPYHTVSDLMRDFQSHAGSKTKLLDSSVASAVGGLDDDDDYGQLYEGAEDSAGSGNGGSSRMPLFDYGTTFDDDGPPPPAPAPSSSTSKLLTSSRSSQTPASRSRTATNGGGGGKIMEMYKTTASRLRPTTYPDYHMMDQHPGYPMTTVRSGDEPPVGQVVAENQPPTHETYPSNVNTAAGDNQYSQQQQAQQQPQQQPQVVQQQQPQPQQPQQQQNQQGHLGLQDQMYEGQGQIQNPQHAQVGNSMNSMNVNKNESYWKWNGTSVNTEVNYANNLNSGMNNNVNYMNHTGPTTITDNSYMGQYSTTPNYMTQMHQQQPYHQTHPYNNVRISSWVEWWRYPWLT